MLLSAPSPSTMTICKLAGFSWLFLLPSSLLLLFRGIVSLLTLLLALLVLLPLSLRLVLSCRLSGVLLFFGGPLPLLLLLILRFILLILI